MSTHPTEKRTDPRPVPQRKGLTFPRYFTTAGRHPFEELIWETRSAVINDERGRVVFEQHDVEVPSTWSQMATNIVASKYFRGQLGLARAGGQRAAADLAGGRHHRRPGAQAAATSPPPRTCATSRTS